jgi:hypothetical protein
VSDYDKAVTCFPFQNIYVYIIYSFLNIFVALFDPFRVMASPVLGAS